VSDSPPPIRGSCLCGSVRFEIDRAVGPFELCHCRRCRKASGSAFVAGLGVLTADFRMLEGAEWVRRYEAPLLERPPAYRVAFCARCGSPVPDPAPDADWFEVPAGLLEDDPHHPPDRHIFVELAPPWLPVGADLPGFTRAELAAHRASHPRPDRPRE